MTTRYVKLGFEAAWGVVDTAPFHPTEVESESMQKVLEFARLATIRSNSTRQIALTKSITNGSVTMPGNYNELGPWLRALFGANDTSGGGDPYTHTFPGASGTTGRAGVSCVIDAVRDAALQAFRYSGVKVTGMQISQAESDVPRFTFDTVGKVEYKSDHTGTDDTSVNAAFMTDSGAAFVVNQFIGWVIVNITQSGATGTITANTATTITATMSSGDWDSGDSYRIEAPTDPTFVAFSPILPTELTMQFDSVEVCARSLTIGVTWPVDETVCLGAATQAREPKENDVLTVTGEATILFDATEMTGLLSKFDGTTDVDVSIVWSKSASRSLTINLNKCRIVGMPVNLDGRTRQVAVVSFESYYDTDATENIQAVLLNLDASVVA